MSKTKILFQHTFLAIKHPGDYYHAARDSRPEEPLESKNIHQSLQFQESDKETAINVLKSLQANYPEIEDFKKSKINKYRYLLVKGNEFNDKNAEVLNRHWVLTREWFGNREYLAEENRTYRNIEYAMSFTNEEAKILSQRQKGDWEPAEFLIVKVNEKEENENYVPKLKEEKDYVIQFRDGFYVAGSRFENLRHETRYLSESTRFSKYQLKETIKEIKDTAGKSNVRKYPKTNEIILHPSLEVGKSVKKGGYAEIERYYAVGTMGKLEKKEYNHYHFQPNKVKNEDIHVDKKTFYYYFPENYRYVNMISKDHLTQKEAEKLKKELDEKYPKLPEHHIVEITILSKTIQIR
jgi:hypothetical protein